MDEFDNKKDEQEGEVQEENNEDSSLEEKEPVIEEEKKSSSDDKKLSRKERKQKEIDEFEEKIKEIQEELDSNLDNNIDVRGSIMRYKQNFPYTLLEIVIGFGLLVGLTGLFTWISHTELYIILLVLFGISFIDNMCSFLIKQFFYRIYMKTFTLIRLVPLIILFLLLSLFGKYINVFIISYGGMIATALIYLIAKGLIMLLIRGSFIKAIFKK